MPLDIVVHGAAQCIFLTNARWNHACLGTRLLSKQISRLQDRLGFIELRVEVQRDMTAKFATAVCATKDLVCDQALKEEIGMSEENGGAIAILIDARHGCRRNAKDSNVVCIRNETYKVLREEHVTREDDAITKRHELLGTRRLYDYFDSYIPSICGPVRISIHAHDRNASLNKFIREECLETLNQNDTWHTAKSVEKEISKVGKDSKKNYGVTWHEQLSDKVHSIRKHV